MEPPGPGGVPRHDFQCCPPIMKKRSAISTKVRAISKIHAISQKKRRYLYDSCRCTKPSEECLKSVVLALQVHCLPSGGIMIPLKDTNMDRPPVIGNLSVPAPD